MIPKKIKEGLFYALLTETDVFGKEEDQSSILRFLGAVWDLDGMPSQDTRFRTATEDIYQHVVNNPDWDWEHLFIQRLKLLEDDSIFRKFLETVVNPAFREDENEIGRFVLLINDYLASQGLELGLEEYDPAGMPVYTVRSSSAEGGRPTDIMPNRIPFVMEFSPSGNSSHFDSHRVPQVFPSFVLAFNEGWNDFGYRTAFDLFHYESRRERTHIGEVKIMSVGHSNTIRAMEREFTELPDAFCSLGQDIAYYTSLREKLGRDFKSVLYALRDAAFFTSIQERFEREEMFTTSLVRYNSVERLLRQARYQVYGYDLSTLYSFRYTFRPPYSDTPVDVDFQFNNTGHIPNRIFGIIGKNGAGKTQLVTSLPLNMSVENAEVFLPRIPQFSKVIAVSYSVFDQFQLPKRTSSFNYVYCGLRNDKGEERTERSLVMGFHSTWKKITAAGRMDQWKAILLNFIDEDIVDLFIVPSREHEGRYEVSTRGFQEAKKRLSSGQSSILYIISEIVAYIRYDSLLLYDEPETHLHPNAITQLMNTIYELVEEFQSYCIIATHSPMVIRELFSRNVFVIAREGNVPSLARIGMESFGQNISTLTDEIFGNRGIPKQYKKIIDRLAGENRGFEEIVQLLESEDTTLSRHARLYIKAVTNN